MKYLALLATFFIFSKPTEINGVPLKPAAAVLATVGYFGNEVRPYLEDWYDMYFSSSGSDSTEKELPRDLEQKLQRLAKKMGVEVNGYADSRWHGSPGWANGGDGEWSVGLDVAKCRQMSPEAVEFLIGHELGHIKRNDLIKRYELGKALLCGVAVYELLCAGILLHIRNLDNGYLLSTVVPILFHCMVYNAFTRKQEYAADAGAVKLLKSAKGGSTFFQRPFHLGMKRLYVMADLAYGGMMGYGLAIYALRKYNGREDTLSANALQIFSVVLGGLISVVLGGLVGQRVGIASSLGELFMEHPHSWHRLARINKLANEQGY